VPQPLIIAAGGAILKFMSYVRSSDIFLSAFCVQEQKSFLPDASESPAGDTAQQILFALRVIKETFSLETSAAPA
jgi:hypothetical protein